MRVLIVGNTDDSDAGFVGERLSDHGAVFTVANRDCPTELAPRSESFDLLLLLGSDSAVHDPRRAHLVEAETALVHQTLAFGTPVLGICYGGQLLARSAGAPVTAAARPEVGWTELDTEDDRLAPAGPWLQFHADRWWPVPATRTLARTALAPQAFQWRRSLGLQFHPEVTPTAADSWVRQYRSLVVASGVDPDQVLQDTIRLWAGAAARCAQLVDDFLEYVAGQRPALAAPAPPARPDQPGRCLA
jgi:GMP synthase-like glutamine amidotransferase